MVSGIGVLLSVSVMLVSATANARYGASLAREVIDAYVMIAAAIFADAGKSLTWIYFATALARRQVLAALTAFVIFCACLLWAVSGSLGYMAMSRAQSTAGVENKSDVAKELDAEIKRKQARLTQSDPFEPSAAIAKKVEAMRQDRRHQASANCTDATVESSRIFCAAMARLEAEQKKSESNESLEREIKELREARNKMGDVVRVERGDFQGALIAQLTNLNLSTIQLSLTVVFVLMIESGACFLMWLSLNFAQTPRANGAAIATQTDDADREAQQKNGQRRNLKSSDETDRSALDAFIEFVEDMIEVDTSASCNIDDIVTTYRAWCTKKNRTELSDDKLALALENFCVAGSLRCEMRDGIFFITGVRLKSSERRKLPAVHTSRLVLSL